MRRVVLTFPLIVALAFGLVVSGIAPAARAQDDATPTADEEEDAQEGITFEFLGFGLGSELGTESDVILTRIIFEPGAVLPLLEEDPEPGLLVTEEGTLTILMEDASLNVLSTDGSFGTEEVEAGTEYELEPGFSVVIPGNESGEIRNDTDEEAVGLAAIISPAESGSDDDDSTDDNGSEDDSDSETDAASDDDSDAATSEVDVEIVDFAFSSDVIEVSAGTTVTWTNMDAAPHTATAEDGSFDSGSLGEGESFSFTFEEPGEYPYICSFHPNMTGTIIVT